MKKLITTFGLALLVSGALAAGGFGQVGPVGTAGTVHVFAAQSMNGAQTVTLAQAVATAQAYNVIIAQPKVYAGYVSQMKAANPNLRIFVYSKGPFTPNGGLPASAYLDDATGKRVTGVQYATYLLNPMSPLAVTAQAQAASAALARSGYDGVYLDTLGPAALSTSFVSSMPIDPSTGATYTPTNWINSTSWFAGQIASQLGKPVIGNGLRDGKNYFNPGTSKLMTTGLGGAVAEAWIRGATAPITAYPNEATWKLNVDALADAGSKGESFMAMTKVWVTGTQAQKDAWYKYTVASFLMGDSGHGYLTFSYQQGDATVDYPLDHVTLGVPTGAYAKINNVYQRSFTAGRVFVNPNNATYTISLGGTFHRLDGTAVTSVTLGPNSAEILTN